MAARVLFSFANTHATMAAADHLADLGVPHRVIPRPVKLAGECGIAMLLPGEGAEAALSALEAADRAPVTVYDAVSDDGQGWLRRPAPA